MCFENRRGYMEKRLFILVVMSCAIVTSCDLLGLGEEKGAPQIKDFTWKVDTLQFPNVMFALNLSGESIDDLWLVNRIWESGMIKFKNNNTYVSTSIHFFSNIKYFKENYYAGGLGGIKRLTLSPNSKIERIDLALNIDRTDLNYNQGAVLDMVVSNENELFLLCSYASEESMPSYTTIVKWDGFKSSVVYTSEWGIQGYKIFAGTNGIFYEGFKIDYEGNFVKSSVEAIGHISNDSNKLFIAGQKESDMLSLGLIGKKIFLKYNEELMELDNNIASSTGVTFPSKTFSFTGYSETNILATGSGGYFVYDGSTWEQLPLPINTNTENRIGEPLLMRDGVVNVITQRPLSTTFYLVRGSPK
jgi:hypothetical protein